MDKYDFLRDKIQCLYCEEDWLSIENKLRNKCKTVFLMWLELVKGQKIEGLKKDEVSNLAREWIGHQRQESEYNKKWKADASDGLGCKVCVYAVKFPEEVFCLQLAKKKSMGGNCKDEIVFRGSEFYGELLEFLDLLKVYE
jgi:hypothetical protein